MTYKKPLKAFNGTTLMGESIVAEDTATSRIGSDAISSLEAHKTIKTEAENRKMLTPFHAVKKADYGVSTEDTERTDPYCGGGTDGDSYTITFIVLEGAACGDAREFKETVKKGDSLKLPRLDSREVLWFVNLEDPESDVGMAGDSYTPTADIALYASCPQE